MSSFEVVLWRVSPPKFVFMALIASEFLSIAYVAFSGVFLACPAFRVCFLNVCHIRVCFLDVSPFGLLLVARLASKFVFIGCVVACVAFKLVSVHW